jgi:hypothetical protein
MVDIGGDLRCMSAELMTMKNTLYRSSTATAAMISALPQIQKDTSTTASVVHFYLPSIQTKVNANSVKILEIRDSVLQVQHNLEAHMDQQVSRMVQQESRMIQQVSRMEQTLCLRQEQLAEQLHSTLKSLMGPSEVSVGKRSNP